MVFGGSFYSSIITYHLLKHILCVLTRLSQMPPFKLANLLRRITLLLATLLQGALSHHSNVRIQADVPYFLVYFPPLAEFLSANFKVKKKLWGMSIFCKCFLSVSKAVLTSLISSLQETWSERISLLRVHRAEDTPRQRPGENPGNQ